MIADTPEERWNQNTSKRLYSVRVNNSSQKDRVLSPKETQQPKRIVGQLIWVSTKTRHDIAYTASIASGSIKDARAKFNYCK